MSGINRELTIEELASLVCSTLDQHGIRVVLSVGNVVSIYAVNEYASFDLDFVPTGLAVRVNAAMQELGFEKQGRHWRHPETDYLVEFPPGPVAIGDAQITDFAERTTRLGVLRLLHPTDCVMDRLTHYFHNGDLQCLDQAIAVAKSHSIDFERIEAWSRGEARHERFQEFMRRLREAR